MWHWNNLHRQPKTILYSTNHPTLIYSVLEKLDKKNAWFLNRIFFFTNSYKFIVISYYNYFS
jgi:hypothetical protein